MNNNTYSNKYRSKQVYEVGIQYLDGNVCRIKADKNDTIYLKENKDNIYISLRRPLDDGTTVTKHTKAFKNAIAAFDYTELPYTGTIFFKDGSYRSVEPTEQKKEMENEDEN